MSKTLKKSLSLFAVLILIAMSLFVLTACGDDEEPPVTPTPSASFQTSSNVKTNTNAVIDNLVENVYNNTTDLGKKTTYSVAEVQEKIDGFTYYVELGTMSNIDQVNSISFGNLTFKAEQTFYLSIGNSNQLLDKVFYVQENKLYVAAPVVAFEAVENAKIKINDNEFNFDLDTTATSINLTNVAFNDGASSEAEKVSDTEYTLNIKSGKEYAGLYYEGATADDVIITKRLLNGEFNGYGMVQPVQGSDGYCSYLYAVGWVEDFNQVNVDKFDGAVYDYSIYITNQDAVANVKLNINVVTAIEVSTEEQLVSAISGDADIVKLTDNIVVENTLQVSRTFTLDLNGKTISNETNIYNLDTNCWAIVSVRANGNLTVTGNGTIHALENDCYACDVIDGGKLVIENGRFIGNISAVYVYEGTAEIKGGEYSIQQLSDDGNSDYRFTLNIQDSNLENSKITVTGGTFHNFDPANNLAEGPNTSFVPEGYTTQLKVNTSDVYEVVLAPQE